MSQNNSTLGNTRTRQQTIWAWVFIIFAIATIAAVIALTVLGGMMMADIRVGRIHREIGYIFIIVSILMTIVAWIWAGVSSYPKAKGLSGHASSLALLALIQWFSSAQHWTILHIVIGVACLVAAIGFIPMLPKISAADKRSGVQAG